MNKAFFKTECGPWKPYAPFFKDGVPIYGTFGILAGPDNIPAYEIRVNELNSSQVGVLLKRWLWQHEDNPTITLEMAFDSLLKRCTIPKHWFSHVVIIGDITVQSEEVERQMYLDLKNETAWAISELIGITKIDLAILLLRSIVLHKTLLETNRTLSLFFNDHWIFLESTGIESLTNYKKARLAIELIADACDIREFVSTFIPFKKKK